MSSREELEYRLGTIEPVRKAKGKVGLLTNHDTFNFPDISSKDMKISIQRDI